MKLFALVALFAITSRVEANSELPSVTKIKDIVAETIDKTNNQVDSDFTNNVINTGKPVSAAITSLKAEVAEKQEVYDTFFFAESYRAALQYLTLADDKLRETLSDSLKMAKAGELSSLTSAISEISSNLDSKTPKAESDSCLNSKIEVIITLTTSIADDAGAVSDNVTQHLKSQIEPFILAITTQIDKAKETISFTNNVSIAATGPGGVRC